MLSIGAALGSAMERAYMQRNFPRYGERFILERSKGSAFTANKEICYLKATFNFWKKKGWIPKTRLLA